MNSVRNLETIKERVESMGRPDVRIVAVSKTRSAKRICELLEAGHADFGENRAGEAKDKIREVASLLPNPTVRPIYHYLGPLQSGQARQIPDFFDYVHGASSLSGIESLLKAARKRHDRDGHVVRYLIQLNLTGETSKLGGMAADEARNLDGFPENDGLRFAGFMAMGPTNRDAEATRDVFRGLREIRDELFPSGELSMGMSGDWETAVKEGATMIRVGSTIFGRRDT